MFNIPTTITWIRILLIPIFVGVYYFPEHWLTWSSKNWIGAAIFWWQGRKNPTPGTKGHDFWVEGCEPICAGLISGWALTGIANSIINVVLYS